MDAAVDRYLTYLAAERRVSPHTLAAYGARLRGAGAVPRARRAARARRRAAGHIVGFLEAEQRRGLSARSRARALAAVRGLFAFLVREGVLAADPSRELRRPRLGRRLPHSPRPQPSVPSCWRAADGDPLVQRDLAMIELIYAAGLRVSEVVGLTVSQVKLEAGYLTVVGKGRKERAVPIGSYARERLLAYLQRRRARSILGRRLSPYLFVTRAGRPMTPPGFWQRLRRRALRPAVSRARSARTPCATPSPRTWSKAAPTCAPSR